MTYSRPVRIILGLIIFALLFWYEYTWYHNSVMSYSLNTPGAAQSAAQEEEAAEESEEAAVTEEAAEPEATPTPEPERPEVTRAAELGLPAPPEIDVKDWQYILVNAAHPLDPIDYEPELGYLNMTGDDTEVITYYDPNRQMVDIRIAEPLIEMVQGCKAAGLPIFLSSGFRSYNVQYNTFANKVNQGYSEDVAATIVARPGTSEHQTGLACDITDRYYELKDSSLEQTATYQWLRDHCAEYGFVVRYPAEKSGGADSITGIIYEPWHFRYVGKEAAKYMTDNNLCLEEFLALYGVE